MLSAASLAMSTRLPVRIEPEASSTRVTLTGVLSELILGAWKAMRARCSPPSRGWLTTSVDMAKLSL